MANTVFIAGPGRSGTSVTRKILEKHSKVAALPFETRFLIDPDGIADFYNSYTKSWSPYLADRKIKRLEAMLLNLAGDSFFNKLVSRILKSINKKRCVLSPKIYSDWELEKYFPQYRKSVKELISEIRKFSFFCQWRGTESYKFYPKLYYGSPLKQNELRIILKKFLDKIIGGLLRSEKADVYVDDTPWNLLMANELFELFDNPKIIHVLRDPRDVIASYRQQKWSPHDLDQAITYYKDIMEHWFNLKANIPSSSYYEFKLEDIVKNPEVIIKEMCQFIGLEYETQLSEIDLSKSHSGRWKEEFNEEEKKKLEETLGELITKLGY